MQWDLRAGASAPRTVTVTARPIVRTGVDIAHHDDFRPAYLRAKGGLWVSDDGGRACEPKAKRI
eukprot:gene747-17256_t